MRSSVKVYSVSGELDKIYYYIWKNGKLNGFYIKDMNGTDDGSVKMLFDVDGEPIGYEVVESDIEREPQTFFFRRNLQGDIVAVCHKGGWDIITYAYDAWGGVQVLTMDSDFALCLFALICTPITYRGYNYDVFTGLYYLQSRYYNPTYGRFLNADSIMKTGEPLGANIFAYCNNNPVNFVDCSGRDALSIITNILYLLVVATVMEYDGLLKKFDYIFEEARSVSFNLFEKNGVFELRCNLICDSGEDFKMYTVYIEFGSIKLAEELIYEALYNNLENDVNSFWTNQSVSLLADYAPEGGVVVFFKEYSENQQKKHLSNVIKFLNKKIDEAENRGSQIVIYVARITKHYSFLGKIKQKELYTCV